MDWEAMAAPWLRVEAETDAAHAPVREGIFSRAGLRSGMDVLDIGPGGGISLLDAADAVGPDGNVTGIEIAPPFAARARARVPDHVTVEIGDAQDHLFEDARFDAAISLFGVMFFRDPVAAFANIRRALKPGAQLTFACWGVPPKNPWFAMPGRVASEVFGPGPAFDPDAPGPMAFGDTTKIGRILSGAGWRHDIETETLHLTPMGTPDEVAAFQMEIGAAAMRMARLKAEGLLEDHHADRVRAGLARGFAAMEEGGAVRVPAEIHFVTATA